MANETIHDVLIAGQGAAGYAAAMYAARYQISPVVFGAVFGGETATGGLIENYPGYPEIDGFELMMKFREHAQKYGVPIVDEDAVSIARRSDCFELTTDEGNTYLGASVILAVGRERRTLGLEHEVEWTGRGVSYCSTCDAPLHRDNVVGVVGGGDSAVKGAALLSKYARQVYVIYRRESFTRPEPVNLRQLESSDNVTTLFNTNVVGLLGDDGLDGVVLDRAARWLERACPERPVHRDRRGPPRRAGRTARSRAQRAERGAGGQARKDQRRWRVRGGRLDRRLRRPEADDNRRRVRRARRHRRLRVREHPRQPLRDARGRIPHRSRRLASAALRRHGMGAHSPFPLDAQRLGLQ